MARKHRLSASVDADLVAAGQVAVAADLADNLRSWVNEALRRQADHDRRPAALGEVLAEYEQSMGSSPTPRSRRPPMGPRARHRRARCPARAQCRAGRVMLVLDAGAFIAASRSQRDRPAGREHRAGRTPVTHGGVVGQVWRGAARHARVGRLLAGVVVVALGEELGRAAGTLLARAGASDVIDAAVVLLAADGDQILTSDARDLAVLAAASGVHADLVPV